MKVFSLNHATLYAHNDDYKGIHIALNTLASDIEMICGMRPNVTLDAQNINGISVIAGSIGKSPIIDTLIEEGKLNVSNIKGKWESYIIQIITNENQQPQLVIAGSDKRGTIYGIYKISECIGISPWVYWADSIPAKKEHIELPMDLNITGKEPSVKYRGFFLNDEAPSLSGWMSKHFSKLTEPRATQGCGSEFYAKVFELLLRLKGNYFWPVMWNNSFHTDDPKNSKLADDMGIVMGTSHHEHMTCADKEWNWHGEGAWNYHSNRDNIYKFWEQGMTKRKDYEAIVTLGMRGQADTSILGPNATLKDNMHLMQSVLTDQRKIVTDVHGRADAVPQMIALYKEVEDFYYGDDSGKLDVPDDVTLMLCDDNFGHLRTLPTEKMRKRRGGFGMYYHFDYRGGPISYEWINQTPLCKVWHNMTMAYEAGIREVWIVNVGDLKPMELPLDYFLNLAYDYDRWSAPNITDDFMYAFAAREFGGDVADDALEVLKGYTKILGSRKAEVVHAQPSTFSLFHDDEANWILDQFKYYVHKAESVYAKLDDAKKATFYQLALYPTRAAMHVYAAQIYAAWSLYFAEKGDRLANDYAQMARDAFHANAKDTEYFNTELSGGKWDGIMRQNHMGYTTWDGPKTHVVPNDMPPLGITTGDSNMAHTDAEPYHHDDFYIAINPRKYHRNTQARGAKWTIISDYGRDEDSIMILPLLASFTENDTSPCIEYCFNMPVYTPKQNITPDIPQYNNDDLTDDFSINLFVAPVNNMAHAMTKPFNEQMRVSLQLNNDNPQTVSCLPQKDFTPGHGEPWSAGVMNNVRIVSVPIGTLEAGQHLLKISAIDPGVVIQKIVIAPSRHKPEIITKAPHTIHFMGRYFGPPVNQ